MLYRSGENRVGETGESAGGVVLAVCQGGWLAFTSGMEVPFFESAASVVEGTELHRDTGADADERCEGAFVESEWAFVGEYRRGTGDGAGVFGCCLETDFDDICDGLDVDVVS